MDRCKGIRDDLRVVLRRAKSLDKYGLLDDYARESIESSRVSILNRELGLLCKWQDRSVKKLSRQIKEYV